MGVIKFCPKCGTKMIQDRTAKRPQFVCPKCKYKEATKDVKIPVVKGRRRSAVRVVGEDSEELKPMPIMDVICPACGNTKAYWWLIQTRGADESPTQFFRCTKCNHTWRVYS